MKHLFTILLLTILLVPATGKAQAANVTDSLALVDLYNSTNGPAWSNKSNWLTGPVNTWYGITVTGDRVTKISLFSNNLSGTLPSSLGNLTALVDLRFGSENITGNIPASLGNLNLLTALVLYNLQLNGSIPDELGNLSNMSFFSLSGNKLSGNIPASLGNFINATYFTLSNNQLTGSIPSSLGNLVNCTSLELQFNKLSGQIPSSFSNLTNVQYLYLHNNQLTGNVPGYFGHFTNIITLFLSNNKFTGQIPRSFFNLENADYIGLAGNQLTQDINIPRWTGTKVNVRFDISNNLFNFNGAEFFETRVSIPVYSPQPQIKIHVHGTKLAVTAGGFIRSNTYKWYKVGETVPTNIITDSTFEPASAGNYYVLVKNAVAKNLTLYSDTISYAPAIKHISQSDAVTNPQMKNAFKIYPNPANNMVSIQAKDAIISITNVEGEILMTQKVAGKATIDVSKLPSGNYYIQNTLTKEKQKLMVVH